jgi:hypothetical protein
MTTKKLMAVLFGVLVILVWILGAAIQAGAETINYKFYVWANKAERAQLDDVDGHDVTLVQRGGFYVFENGEITTIRRVSLNDLIKGAGPYTLYETMTFSDGSTMMLKGQGMLSGSAVGQHTSGEAAAEIIKGTGRFEGAKGTQRYKMKFLPADKGEAGPKQYGEGTITYTLPAK